MLVSGSSAPPGHCPICEDERQYVGPDGQQWTTLDQLRATGAEIGDDALSGAAEGAGQVLVLTLHRLAQPLSGGRDGLADALASRRKLGRN